MSDSLGREEILKLVSRVTSWRTMPFPNPYATWEGSPDEEPDVVVHVDGPGATSDPDRPASIRVFVRAGREHIKAGYARASLSEIATVLSAMEAKAVAEQLSRQRAINDAMQRLRRLL